MSEIFSIWLDLIQCKTKENGRIFQLNNSEILLFATGEFLILLINVLSLSGHSSHVNVNISSMSSKSWVQAGSITTTVAPLSPDISKMTVAAVICIVTGLALYSLRAHSREQSGGSQQTLSCPIFVWSEAVGPDQQTSDHGIFIGDRVNPDM